MCQERPQTSSLHFSIDSQALTLQLTVDQSGFAPKTNTFWDNHITPTLTEYIKIPNKSPSFDPDWKKSGHMDTVLNLATEWVKKHLPSKATLLVKESKGKTPLLLVDVPGTIPGNSSVHPGYD